MELIAVFIQVIGLPGVVWFAVALIGLPVMFLFIEGKDYSRNLLLIAGLAFPAAVISVVLSEWVWATVFLVLGAAVSYWHYYNKQAPKRERELNEKLNHILKRSSGRG